MCENYSKTECSSSNKSRVELEKNEKNDWPQMRFDLDTVEFDYTNVPRKILKQSTYTLSLGTRNFVYSPIPQDCECCLFV